MKVTLEQIWVAYNTLGKAKITKLDEAETIKVLKARKAMRTYVDELRAYEEDVEEKIKPEGFEEQANIYNAALEKIKADKFYTATQQENDALKAVTEFFNKKGRLMQEELSKEAELNIEYLSVESEARLLAENGWEAERLDEILIVDQSV